MDDVILTIQTLISAQFGTDFKKYYYGENKVPEQSVFPFLEVVPLSTSIINRGTGGMTTDEFRIRINLKDSLKNHLTTNTDKNILGHMQWIIKKMEERDSSGRVKPSTVIGVLQSDLQLNNKALIVDDWEASYTETPYGESWMIIGSLDFVARKIISC